MFTEIYQPKKLTAQALDRFLERGWFRMGQMIFTCHLLCFHDELYSTVWTRLALSNYTFKRRLRKLMRRNNRRFDIRIRKAVFDSDKERLYQMHTNRFEGYVADSLLESLQGEETINIYNTYEIAVYDGKRLAAVSFFDIGERSLASIMGLYDPAYSQYSLGIFTMLMEIKFGLEHDKHFYYPGYVVPGYSKFDYKLRIGEVDFFDARRGNWRPYSEIDLRTLPAENLKQKLTAVQEELTKVAIPFKEILYPLYDKKLFGLKEEETVRSPLLISCFHREETNEWMVIEYNLFKKKYQLSEISRIEDISILLYQILEGYDREKSCLNFLLRDRIILETAEVNELIFAVKAYRNER
ncbi:MAG: hypothetical protein AAGG75_03445 [Bacteroidota bacterium]